MTNIKGEGNGQHKDCNICFIKEIKDEKRNKLKDNLKLLEDLSNTFKKSINEIKILFEKMTEDKDKLKLKVQNIFTKFRNILNEREDEIILEIDNKFNNKYLSEDIVKQTEILPNKINKSLEKGRKIEKEWEDNNKFKWNSLVYDCINIEKNIENINTINEKIKKYKSNNKIIGEFFPENNKINEYLEVIKTFRMIYYNNFKFKECPLNISDNRKYTVTGENKNILTKTGSKGWMGTICENKLEKKENKWRVKILTPETIKIMVGVAPIDFDINSSSYNTCGWYFHSGGYLYSGPPHNYNGLGANLGSTKDEIIVVMNMEKKTLKFIIDNKDKGDSYTNIPLDKPLFPVVLLKMKNASVEINEILD